MKDDKTDDSVGGMVAIVFEHDSDGMKRIMNVVSIVGWARWKAKFMGDTSLRVHRWEFTSSVGARPVAVV